MSEDNSFEARDSLNSSLEGTPPEQQPVEPPLSSSSSGEPTPPSPPSPPKEPHGHHFLKRSSIYFLLFIVLVVAVAAITVVDYKHTHKPATPIAEQNLSPKELTNLASANEVVGSGNQVLTIQSSSIFNGQVLVKQDLSVAGKLEVGGSLSLTGIQVSGNSTFDQMQINKNLSVGGNEAIQGTLAVQNDLSVSGSGSFAGGITAPQATLGSLQLNGDLNLTRHLAFIGSIPHSSSGGSLGSGGTSSVSGSDSAGTVSFNTGTNPGTGCYITVDFANPFRAQPHVNLTPASSAAASLQYYVNRSTTSFSVCGVNNPVGGQSYSFDYFITD